MGVEESAHGLVQRFLIGFYGEEIIGSHFLDDQARRFLMGVERIQNQDLAA